MKNLIIISVLLNLFSCNKVKEYQCVCYYGIGTDSVSYESYVTKNNKIDSEKYCDMVSKGKGVPCWVPE